MGSTTTFLVSHGFLANTSLALIHTWDPTSLELQSTLARQFRDHMERGTYTIQLSQNSNPSFCCFLTLHTFLVNSMSGPIFGQCPADRDWIRESSGNPATGRDWVRAPPKAPKHLDDTDNVMRNVRFHVQITITPILPPPHVSLTYHSSLPRRSTRFQTSATVTTFGISGRTITNRNGRTWLLSNVGGSPRVV
jgi:hypothetical protein